MERLNIAVAVGEEIIVDLRCNNGRKPKFDEFWDIVADHISDKTAINDRRHSAASSTETNDVVVNMAFALSYADLYRKCVKLAQEKNIDTIPFCYNSGQPTGQHLGYCIILEGFE